ncbi:putative signal recognition particle 68 kDa protein [Toxoplasma gondii GAB2-2007-GAL-DOM2]|uniref:Signal recognition particle subunit SRP68 n=2 Tax=Toxoplasma gondii TaxID=5811 RepID=A0A086JNP8_TOXGO|nr:putative signal recognition particle 68 kDa protein [Toxoplasma gondii GAB2-2007-GAL-DOM2]
MAEALEAERPEGAFRSFSLSLSLYVEERREANGLRHGDFLRYRRYCSARLDRLRASLELRQGRNRFQQKKLPVVIRDERVLLLVLTQAERAWSYAMQLKGENAASAVVNLRVRRHCIRRLSKALLYARLLENLCHSETPCMQTPPPPVSDSKAAKGASGKKEETKSSGKKPQAEEAHALLRQPHALPAEEVAAYFLSLGCECVSLCDEKTKLESRAYRLSILAALEQEQENWEAARETLEELRQVYIHLKRVSSTHERETALFKTLLARTEPELRLCAFHSGGVASLAKAGLAGSDRGEKTSGEKRMQSSCPALVVWRGDEVFVEAEKPRKGVLGALSLVEEVQLLKTEALTTLAHADSAFEDSTLAERLEALSQEDAERLVERYGDLSSRFRLCVDLIHAEMLKHPDVPSWYLAEGYCLDISRCLEVERDILLLLRFFLNLRRSDEKSPGPWQHKHQNLRGDAGVRYASLLQQGIGKMMEEENLDQSRKLRMQQWMKIAKDSRALCLAVFDASVGKLPEAYVLAAAVSSRSKTLVPQPQVGETRFDRNAFCASGDNIACSGLSCGVHKQLAEREEENETRRKTATQPRSFFAKQESNSTEKRTKTRKQVMPVDDPQGRLDIFFMALQASRAHEAARKGCKRATEPEDEREGERQRQQRQTINCPVAD